MRALALFTLVFTISAGATTESPDGLALKRCDGAKGSLSQVLAICDESLKEPSLTVRTRARIHAVRGNAYRSSGDSKKAMSEYEESLRIDPLYPYGYNNRGALWNQAGEPRKALPEFNKAIELDPKNPNFLSNRGATWESWAIKARLWPTTTKPSVSGH